MGGTMVQASFISNSSKKARGNEKNTRDDLNDDLYLSLLIL